MVISTQIFEGTKGTLRLEIQSNDWTRCYLITGQEERYLGAETLNYIKAHISSAFDDNEKVEAGEIDGQKVFWVLSLGEAHHSIYGMKNEDRLILPVQDSNANIVGVIELLPAQQARWKEYLSA